jgi:hypothetical protein
MIKIADTVDGFIKQFDVVIQTSVFTELDNVKINNKYYIYEWEKRIENAPFVWNIYGAYEQNRLYVEMKMDSGERYIGRINSPVLSPPMIDRAATGIDQLDAHYVGILTDWMVSIYIDGLTLEQVIEKLSKVYNKTPEREFVNLDVQENGCENRS